MSETNKKKSAWVLSFYEPFCKKMKEYIPDFPEPFPLKRQNSSAFLRFLGKELIYKFHSIQVSIFIIQ